jgi:membrane protease YdiL (CAAX protease family)
MVSTGLAAGKNGFLDLGSRLIRRRVNIRWYGVALLTAPLSTMLVLLVLSLFSSGFSPAFMTADEKNILLVMWIAGGIIVAFFEELGWTGFANPWLRKRYRVFTTGLLIGVIWGAWHFLVNWESNTFSGVLPFVLLLARLFTWLPAYRILMVWLYNRTESLCSVILMHLSLVATTGIIDPVLDGEKLLVFLLVKAAVLWAVVFIVFAMPQRVGWPQKASG